jgi:FkbM family methyltransferase
MRNSLKKALLHKLFLKTRTLVISLFVQKIKYRLGSLFIFLPARHTLPYFLKLHRNYDRFLPHFVNFLDDGAVVIDVGANVGDTLALMVSENPRLSYIAIEGSEKFFQFLSLNVELIKKQSSVVDIEIVNALVGTNLESLELKEYQGTAALRPAVGLKLRQIPLDHVIAISDSPRIDLIKIDTDGFDFSVIESANDVINRTQPCIFFELQFDYTWQIEGYSRVLRNLNSRGYTSWTFFDNFGSLLLTTEDFNIVVDLMRYLELQNQSVSDRTIYHFDVLTCTAKHKELIGRTVNEY